MRVWGGDHKIPVTPHGGIAKLYTRIIGVITKILRPNSDRFCSPPCRYLGYVPNDKSAAWPEKWAPLQICICDIPTSWYVCINKKSLCWLGKCLYTVICRPSSLILVYIFYNLHWFNSYLIHTNIETKKLIQSDSNFLSREHMHRPCVSVMRRFRHLQLKSKFRLYWP